MKNIFDLSKKVVVVTGGAGLIGQAYVEALASSGALVYIAEHDAERAENVRSSLCNQELKVKVVILDISNQKSVESGIEKILSAEGHIDGWINNAYPRTKDWGLKFEEVPFESWQKNVDLHLNGYCLCCQKVAEVMKKQNSGSIINVASTYGIVGPDFSVYDGTEMTMPAAYAAIKGGIINFTRYLASYYGSFGVRVNCISPGGVFDNQPESFVKKYSEKTPLKRMAKPNDMTGAVVYLASDASLYVTGHNLVVDGGWSVI